MFRNVIRAATILIAAIAVAVPAALAASSSARASERAPLTTAASDPVRLCETANVNRCVGSDSFALYEAVRQKNPGRDLGFETPGGGTCFVGDTCVIKFSGASNRCVAASTSNAHNVDIKQCSGTDGILWFVGTSSSGNSLEFVNKYWYDHGGHTWFLEGNGVLGDRFHVNSEPGNGHYNFKEEAA